MSAWDYFNLIWNFGTMSETLKVYSDIGGIRGNCVCALMYLLSWGPGK